MYTFGTLFQKTKNMSQIAGYFPSKGIDFIVFTLKEYVCFKAVHTGQDE